MNDYGVMPGRYPAVIKTYDAIRRTCRIEILGLTTGGEIYPEAEIEYPVGEKSKSGEFSTEIEFLPGDAVWISFIGGDSRYPIITGYRNPQSGNGIDWRRFHHKNMELASDQQFNVIAGRNINMTSNGTVTIKTDSVFIDAPEIKCNGDLTVSGSISASGSIMDAGREKFQKALSKTKVQAPKGIRTSAPRLEQFLTEKRDALITAIDEIRKQIKDLREDQLPA